MSRSYSTADIAMDGVRGAGMVIGVLALILVALAGFADGYSRVSPMQVERGERFVAGMERARTTEPSELLLAAAQAPESTEPTVAAPTETAAPAEPAAVTAPEPLVTSVTTEAPAPVESFGGPA